MKVILLVKINGMDFPLDRKYYIKNGAHIWLKQEKDVIKIGLDAFATQIAGPIDFIYAKKGQVKSNEVIGSFESTKFVSKLHSPINGEIITINTKVVNQPKSISNKPYDSWIVEIKPDNPNINGKYILEEKEKITIWILNEIKRLKNNK